MELRCISDWTTLIGANVEIQRKRELIASGQVDAVTVDGSVLWLESWPGYRRLYEKAELYEAWANESRLGFHYRVTEGTRAQTERAT